MTRTVSADEARQDVDAIFASVRSQRQSIIVEENGRRIAVVINPDDFERLLDREAAADWAAIDRMRELNADLDPDEVLAEVTAIVEEVRQRRYDEKQRDQADRY